MRYKAIITTDDLVVPLVDAEMSSSATSEQPDSTGKSLSLLDVSGNHDGNNDDGTKSAPHPPSTPMAVLRDGRRIQSHAQPGALARTTGWVTWNASLVVLRYLEDHCEDLVKQKVCGDLSSGNGLIAVGLSLLGARRVLATEVTSCIELTRANVDINRAIGFCGVEVQEFFWGTGPSPFSKCEAEPFDLVVACDLLFIGIRDSLLDELATTVINLCKGITRVLFVYEERLPRKESNFIEELSRHIDVKAIPLDKMDLSICRNPQSDETEENDEFLDIFYQPPTIHMFLCKERRGTREDK